MADQDKKTTWFKVIKLFLEFLIAAITALFASSFVTHSGAKATFRSWATSHRLGVYETRCSTLRPSEALTLHVVSRSGAKVVAVLRESHEVSA